MAKVSRKFLFSDYIVSDSGIGAIEERFVTLKKQVPVIYILILVNSFGLYYDIFHKIEVGINMPTLIAMGLIIRSFQWFTFKHDSSVSKFNFLKKTDLAVTVLCSALSIWYVILLKNNFERNTVEVLLFGCSTAVGSSYGLSSSFRSARLPLITICVPLVLGVLYFTKWSHFGAALSVAAVNLLMLRMLKVQGSQFADLIKSRSVIRSERHTVEQAREQAEFQAATDFLTGLRNRRSLISEIEVAIGQQAPGLAVAILDLDRFKRVNDTFGHATGDCLLKIVADRLILAAGPTATVARLGGDEFAVLFRHVNSTIGARVAGLRLLVEVNRPTEINGRLFPVSGSIGMSLMRDKGDRSPSRLLADADLALYESKADASSRLTIFEPRMEAPLKRRADIERALQAPDLFKRLKVAYQPIVDLQTGDIISAEALARWDDPQLGEVSPAEFIPIAEELSVIALITDRVMEQALREARTWAAHIRLSMNVSALHLCNPGWADDILRRLTVEKFPPARLEVEVTETALLSDFERARDNLATLRAAGVRIVLDDFGSGFASVAYLREINFDQIKLDGSLVIAAETSPEGEHLLRGVIGLCQALGASTVAEHIETEGQLKLLRILGCRAGQGFLLNAPCGAGDPLFASGFNSLLTRKAGVLGFRAAA